MTTPDRICDMTLEALREVRTAMMSTEWQLELDGAAPDIKRQSGLLLGRVQGEILRLENAQLATIAAALAANGDRLAAAAVDVRKEIRKIAHIAKILKCVDQLVKLAIKIVPKVVGLPVSPGDLLSPAPGPQPEPEPEPEPEPYVPGTFPVRGPVGVRRVAAPKAKRKAAVKARSKPRAKPKAKAKAKPKARPKPAAKTKRRPATKSRAKAGRKAGPARRAR